MLAVVSLLAVLSSVAGAPTPRSDISFFPTSFAQIRDASEASLPATGVVPVNIEEAPDGGLEVAENAAAGSGSPAPTELSWPIPLSSAVPVAAPLQQLNPLANASPQSPLVAAYLPDWTNQTPDYINFTLFDWIDYAFAIPQKDFSLSLDDSLLTRLVELAHGNNTNVKLSIGGWGNGQYFSSAVSTDANREKFAENIAETYKKYDLDGIDIDWEFPGQQVDDQTPWSPDDTSNFLEFLKCLRTKLPDNARITAACEDQTFVDSTGHRSENVTDFASALDWILIMNYDINQSSSTPGANAPLSDGCYNTSQPGATAEDAVKTWVAAGMPANQIVLGVPSYGYVSSSSQHTLQDRQVLGVEAAPTLAASDEAAQAPSFASQSTSTSSATSPYSTVTGASAGALEVAASDSQAVAQYKSDSSYVTVQSDDGGQVQFNSLVAQYALEQNSDGEFVGAGGFERYWDECSSTPFLRSEYAKQVISYDDPQSLELKASFALNATLLGVNMFDVHGDTEAWDLTNALWRGLGKTGKCNNSTSY